MNLPPPVRAYFEADRECDGDALVHAFAPDAVVRDEGRAYAGHHAIGAWWRETKDRYQAMIEPLAVADEDDVATVRARVTGRFPGSPATLSFNFQLNDERISRLEIEA